MTPPRETSDSEDGDYTSLEGDSGDDTDTLPGQEEEENACVDEAEEKTKTVKGVSSPPTTPPLNILSNGDISEEAASMVFGPEDDIHASLNQLLDDDNMV